MANEVISYLEICHRESVSLQRGMNCGLSGNQSVILMLLRPNVPYEDKIQDGGTVLIYEGTTSLIVTVCLNRNKSTNRNVLPVVH